MPTTATIDRDQRDGIFEVVRNHLGAIGDIWIALEENDDFEVAERLGREFGEDFRLLADIGWSPNEERRAFAFTMPALELIALLDRLSEEAERVLLGAAAKRESERADAATRCAFSARPRCLRGNCWSTSTRPGGKIMNAAKPKRLGPGELDGLVLAYLATAPSTAH